MSKYMTGFCQSGFCEGTKPISPSGKPVKVCHFIDMCQCECHVKVSKMFEMAGAERIVMQNPDYVPHDSGIYEFLESYQKMKAEELPTLVKKVAVQEKPVTTADGSIVTGLARSGRTFEPTQRGRAAGQLEDEIRGICNRFLQGEFPDEEMCTPKFIAYKIAEETDSEKTPSIGAIGAAFDRWDKIGFALIKKNPVRFVSFTVDGMTLGLEALKLRAKNDAPRKLRSAR